MNQILIAVSALAIIIWIFSIQSRLSRSKNMKIGPWPHELDQAEKDAIHAEEDINPIKPEDLDYTDLTRAYRIADMHFARGNLEEAEKWFINVLAFDPNHSESLNRLGVIYIQQGNARRAEILYRKLLSITQKESAYYCNYGRCLYNQKRPQEAIEAYDNALKLDSSRPSRFVSVGQIYYELKDYVKALSYFVKALDLDPQNKEYLSITAELAELVGDTDRMHKSLERIAEMDPYNEAIKNKLEALRGINPAKQ